MNRLLSSIASSQGLRSICVSALHVPRGKRAHPAVPLSSWTPPPRTTEPQGAVGRVEQANSSETNLTFV